MLGCRARSSSSRTATPPCASSHASINPVGPAPTTTTSTVSTRPDSSRIRPRRLPLTHARHPRRPRGRHCAGTRSRLPLGTDGVLPAGVGPAGIAGLGGDALAGRRPADDGRRAVGARTVDEHHAAVRRARGDHERAGAGDRRACPLLLRRLLPPPRRAHGEAAAEFRGRTGRVLRRHVRSRRQRQHVGALRVLGAHHGAVVPSGRPLRGACHQQAGGHPGVVGDDVRRAGDARGHHRAGEPVRHLSAVRTDRRTADGCGGLGRCRARPRRGTVQIGDRSDALLAARCDGGPDSGQRLSARRGDGQSGRVSRRADGAGIRRFSAVASHRDHARCAHHAAGGLAGGA